MQQNVINANAKVDWSGSYSATMSTRWAQSIRPCMNFERHSQKYIHHPHLNSTTISQRWQGPQSWKTLEEADAHIQSAELWAQTTTQWLGTQSSYLGKQFFTIRRSLFKERSIGCTTQEELLVNQKTRRQKIREVLHLKKSVALWENGEWMKNLDPEVSRLKRKNPATYWTE